MSVASSRHSAITLFSHPNSIYSHLVRFVMAEKNVLYDLVEVENGRISEQLLEYNPYGEVPTLTDRDIVIYRPNIILEYLDERYPHPPLMPVFPKNRAETRLLLHRMEMDWYSLANKVIQDNDETAAKDLKDTLLSSSEALRNTEFFLSDEFSMIDCYVAPLLWRLPMMNINLTGSNAKIWQRYMNSIFARETFKNSLTNDEINQRAISVVENKKGKVQ